MIASAKTNKKLEMVLQYNPLHKEYVTFDLAPHPEGTTLSLTRKSYGVFSFLSVVGFEATKSKTLDNLGYIIPEEDLASEVQDDKSSNSSDTSDNLFEDRNLMAAYLVNKTLDGDASIIKATADVYSRGKAKALLIKINKGTAERPPMPEPGAAATTPPESVSVPSMSKEDTMAVVVNKALDGDEGPLNELTDKVLRAKSKSLIMKINKGTAERPPMPEPGPTTNEIQNNKNQADANTETEEELFARLVESGINDNMDEINSLDNKILRGKIKAAIVKAKRTT